MGVLLALAAIASQAYQNYKQEQDKEKMEQYEANEIQAKNKETRRQALGRAINFDESKTRYPRETPLPPGESNLAFAKTLQGVATAGSALPWEKIKNKNKNLAQPVQG